MEDSIKQRAKDEVSFLGGCRYLFSYQRHRIELWTSNFTGKEVVKVNGNIVSQARSYRKNNKHCFIVNGQPLVLEIRIDSLLKGPLYCTLLTQDATGQLHAYARKRLLFWPEPLGAEDAPEKVKTSWWKRLLGFGEVALAFFVGAWLSRTYSFWSLDFWLILLAIAFTFSFIKSRFTASHRKSSNKKQPTMPLAVIEDIPLQTEANNET